jgi:predicted ribosomally synthesized peptide with SipW-like signal peptide
MIKRIILSVIMITVAVSAVAAATSAYFSDGKVLSANTFATGTVKIGELNVTSLNVTGLTPGVPVLVPNIGVNYTGTINADLFVGARGTSQPQDSTFLANILYLRIFQQGTQNVVWEGLVSDLSTGWRALANNISAGWQAYDLQFTLDQNVGNSKQNITNIDTEILIYAVQHGGTVPSTVPYLTTGLTWF